MLAVALFAKGLGFIGQIVTAWYLSEHDFKLLGLTYAFTALPNLIRDAGLTTILVRRQRHLRRWVSPVFWMSITAGLVSAAVMIASAPLGAKLYNAPELTRLVWIVAAGAIAGSIGTVPTAVAQIQLRFRFQAIVGLGGIIFMQLLCMTLAWRGWGAASYVIPNAAVNLLMTIIYWVAAPAQLRPRLHLKRWKFVLSDSGALLAAGGVAVAISQGDYLTVNLMHRASNDNTGGIFFFAFNLSWQLLTVLTTNVSNVLFPTLSKLQNDPPRQIDAYLRAARLLALISFPACFLQAAVAQPGFHLVFGHKWDSAIVVMQILSLAMAVRAVGLTWIPLSNSQGRFRMQMKMSAAFAAVFLVSVAIASSVGRARILAATEAVFFIIFDPLGIYLMLRASGVAAGKELARLLGLPLVMSAVAVGLGWLAARLLPAFHWDEIPRIAITSVVAGGIYLALVRRFARADWNAVWALRRSRSAAID